MSTDTDKESIADIVAEMRKEAQSMFPSLPIAVLQLASRIESAAKRERVGNVAKLREALVRTDSFLSALGKWLKVNDESQEYALAAGVIHTLVEHALAALPRNCDRYSHDEALRVWAAEKENERNGCFDEWLYNTTTEQEGENNGGK